MNKEKRELFKTLDLAIPLVDVIKEFCAPHIPNDELIYEIEHTSIDYSRGRTSDTQINPPSTITELRKTINNFMNDNLCTKIVNGRVIIRTVKLVPGTKPKKPRSERLQYEFDVIDLIDPEETEL